MSFRSLTQPWQVPLSESPTRLDPAHPFVHRQVGNRLTSCPISGRTEPTLRMEGEQCSFCLRPTQRRSKQ